MPTDQRQPASHGARWPAWLPPLLLGLLAAIPAGVALALLRRYIGLFLAANEYRRALLDHAVDGMVVIDDQDRIQAFNPAAEQIFGYRADEMIGRELREIVAPPDHVMHRLISIGREVGGIRRDGARFPMDMTSGQMQLRGQRMYVLIMRDATRRKQIEGELRQARDAAEAASRAKSAILLTMTHELRTPLNHIIGYGELVREELAERGQADLLPDMQRIDASGRHLLGQIDRVLELASLEAGEQPNTPRRFPVAQLLAELAQHFAADAARAGSELRVACDPQLELVADRARGRLVLCQLIANACAHARAAQITLAAHSAPGELTIAVSDTGVGIAPERAATLFEPFQVGGVTTRRQGGVGLGLAIARQISRLIGAELRLSSEPGRGSTFSLHFTPERG